MKEFAKGVRQEEAERCAAGIRCPHNLTGADCFCEFCMVAAALISPAKEEG